MNTHTSPRVLVTGGAHGIGAAIVEQSLSDGYQVVVIDRDRSDTATMSITADLSDDDSTREALEAALRDGPITRVVNNVGAVFPASVEDQNLDELRSAFELNVRTAFQCVQALVPGMKEEGFGRIVSISSRASLGKSLRSAYSMTKAGLLGLTRVWALELGEFGITANAIGPGPIATELFTRANPPEAPRTQAIINAIPVRAMGTPEHIAHSASYFLDERSSFTTGQTLYVCGGMTVGVNPL